MLIMVAFFVASLQCGNSTGQPVGNPPATLFDSSKQHKFALHYNILLELFLLRHVYFKITSMSRVDMLVILK